MIIWTVSQIAQNVPRYAGRGYFLKVLSSQYFPKSMCCQSSVSISMTVPCCYQPAQFISRVTHPSLQRVQKTRYLQDTRAFSTLKSNFKHSTSSLIACIGFLEVLMSYQLCCVTIAQCHLCLPAPRVDILFPKQLVFEDVP